MSSVIALEVGMGRKGGRPRKTGERYPGGRLKPATEGIPPALLARVKANVVKFFADPRFSTPFGTLALEGVFTTPQWGAGNRIGEIYHTYHRLKQLRENPKSPNYEGGFHGSSDLAEERMSKTQLEAHEAKITAAEAAWRTVDSALASVPRNVREGVIELCVNDRSVNPALYGGIARFLDQMSLRWPEARDRRTDTKRRVLPTLRSTPLLATAKTTAAPPKGPDPTTLSLERVVHAIRPDLDSAGVRQVTEAFHALRDREVFRRGKRNR